MAKYHAVAEIIWQKPDQIQQKLNLGQATYALNIKFEGVDGLWSAVLILEDLIEIRSEQPQLVKIGFLFPDQVKGFLVSDQQIQISEGPSRLVGTGRIVMIENM